MNKAIRTEVQSPQHYDENFSLPPLLRSEFNKNESSVKTFADLPPLKVVIMSSDEIVNTRYQSTLK